MSYAINWSVVSLFASSSSFTAPFNSRVTLAVSCASPKAFMSFMLTLPSSSTSGPSPLTPSSFSPTPLNVFVQFS
ncbi:hypothetical protein EDC04DRAFT_2834042 [Pisolithus marmoratus]|nr:hypothetical protein EDC04DRAFT_2834042 [Pisolithus marmoratus]